MPAKDRIRSAVFHAIDEVNEQLPEERRLTRTPETVLWGPQGGLDSLGLVNLIVAVEEKIEDEYGVTVNLADQRAASETAVPFSTIESLVEYLARLLEGRIGNE